MRIRPSVEDSRTAALGVPSLRPTASFHAESTVRFRALAPLLGLNPMNPQHIVVFFAHTKKKGAADHRALNTVGKTFRLRSHKTELHGYGFLGGYFDGG